jgi:HEAT repeat protein
MITLAFLSLSLAVSAVTQTNTTETLVAALTRATSDPDPHVRAEAAKALADFGAKSAVLQLIALLNDDNGFVRNAAVDSLEKLGDRSAAPALVHELEMSVASAGTTNFPGLLFDDRSKTLTDVAWLRRVEKQSRIIRGLGELKDVRAVDAVMEHGLRSPDVGIRTSAAIALGRIAATKACAAIERELQRYYDALPKDGSHEPVFSGALPGAMQEMRQKEAYFRAAAAWALGRIGSPTAVTVLRRAANDENSFVRETAAEAFDKIADPEKKH